MASGPKTFKDVLVSALSKKEEIDLNEPETNTLRLLRLLVDIEYERRYGSSLDPPDSRGYFVNKE